MGLFDAVGGFVGDVAGGLVGGLAGGIAKSTGIKNDFKATPYEVDSSAYAYNDPKQQIYRNEGDIMRSRAAAAYGANTAGRADQQRLAGTLMETAYGRGPTASGQVLNQGMDAARAMGAGQVATAIGAGVNPALAYQLSNGMVANNVQQASRDAAIMRVGEQAQARDQLGQVLAQSRGQDLNAFQLGTSGSMGYANLDQAAINNQMMAMIERERLKAQQYAIAQQINAGVASQNTGIQGQLVGGIFSAAGDMGAAAIKGPV